MLRILKKNDLWDTIQRLTCFRRRTESRTKILTLVDNKFMVCLLKKKKKSLYDVAYTIRRYLVDEFHIRNIDMFKQGSVILDMGGKKKRKRGYFNIENSLLSVKYANIDISSAPDFACDIANLPILDALFDGVLCSEVLEHVIDPKKVMKEAFRVLKPGGKLLICVPFIFKIHSAPQDYGRYTDSFWQTVLRTTGFTNIEIERQGLFFSVASEMLTSLAHQMLKEQDKSKIMRRVLCKLSVIGKKIALQVERKTYFKEHPFFNSYTTGYGIIAIKPV